MTRFSLAAAAAALIANTALAADPVMMDPVPAPLPVPVGYDWSGFYVGLNGGYAFDGENDWSPAGVSNDLDGWFVGGTLGAQWQWNWFVAGVEGDIDWADIGESEACPNPVFACSTEINWIATLRARAGVAVDRVLIFATGGLAAGGVDQEASPAVGGGSFDETMVGWTAGGGAEVGITQRLSAKLEYSYYDLGTDDSLFSGIPTGTDVDFQAVKFGVNWRF